ncbi:unnamed protein product [Penicillium salamii]|uniref:NAD(P)-binding domain-containing protein n=1 Tax=Penicillium salamii TaxID=1612424 RepID=A0A9W4JED6_9EURO|nr:unnamed protein product [Penicillium salamii]CAG8080346.1 unnamed protein product [Penicillium salamii]CAG8118606.1 unnamed protein product [Penicillium salamii]CAG8131871.1 unnamed protein product [Penicillium salamii]CAG8267629.1 unnamed protein product [Penicillium salamii]
MPQIFLTGATGYIGGEILHTLQQTHPDYNVSVLIRDQEKANKVTNAFPKVRVVLADLDDVEIIEEESRNANVVIHAASNKHIASVKAIAKGLEGRPDGHYIQVTGASVLAGPEVDSNSYGEPSDKIYDDLDNVGDLQSIIRAYKDRRVVDNFILDLGSSGPKTAIIFPPIIFGAGNGPVNQRSIQIPSLAKSALQQHAGLYLNKGLSRWGVIHVSDLASLFVKLAEHAIKATPIPIWNENGLFFAENGFESFKDIAGLIAKEAHSLGYIKSPDSVKSINLEEANAVIPGGVVFLGTNGQGRALRARELVGWQPKGVPFPEAVRETIASEAARL